MLEEELLKLRFKCGSQAALERIYETYVDYLLTLAVGLLRDRFAAEDVVHDTFVRLAQSRQQFRMRGNLRSYLATCVVNRVRDRMRQQQAQTGVPTGQRLRVSPEDPYERVVGDELSRHAHEALNKLPYEQREALVLHVKADMTFAEIAKLQGASLRTVQGRYRYGLDKLRYHLNGRVKL